jgi:hypothetical protein
MSDTTTDAARDHRLLYGIVIGVFGILLIVMLIAYDYDKSNDEAEALADELVTKFEDAGLPVPDNTDQLTQTLGTDGGLACQIAGDEGAQNRLQTLQGVGGEFYQRPVRLDRRLVEGALLVVSVYCPDDLAEAEDFVAQLRLDDLVRD